jgi:integrase
VRPRLHKPKYEPKEKLALTAQQIQRVIACVELEHRPLIVCAALTGLRIGEILALKWQDIDFARRLLTVSHNLWHGHLVTPKTKSSKRTVYISGPLAEVLEAHYQYSRWKAPAEWVFARAKTAALTTRIL